MTNLFPKELDAALAERLFPWNDDRRLCKLAWEWISETGHPFELKDGSKVYCPPGADLPQPQDTIDWNSRYALYVGKLLLRDGKITADDVGNVMSERPGLSTTGDGMLLVLEAMRERGWGAVIVMGRQVWSIDVQTAKCKTLSRARADTLPRAVALAALAALDKEVER